MQLRRSEEKERKTGLKRKPEGEKSEEWNPSQCSEQDPVRPTRTESIILVVGRLIEHYCFE
jgi:hypothetical protein